MVVLTISFSDKKETIEFVAAGKYTVPMLLDVDDQMWSAYRISVLPVLVLIDRQGIIRGAYRGPEEIPVQNLEDLLAEGEGCSGD